VAAIQPVKGGVMRSNVSAGAMLALVALTSARRARERSTFVVSVAIKVLLFLLIKKYLREAEL
jgi:hypothetical protein